MTNQAQLVQGADTRVAPSAISRLKSARAWLNSATAASVWRTGAEVCQAIRELRASNVGSPPGPASRQRASSTTWPSVRRIQSDGIDTELGFHRLPQPGGHSSMRSDRSRSARFAPKTRWTPLSNRSRPTMNSNSGPLNLLCGIPGRCQGGRRYLHRGNSQRIHGKRPRRFQFHGQRG